MPRSLLLASTVSLGLLSGFIFILVVIFSIFVGDMGGGLIGAIATTIVINFLLWLVSPWCSDWMYRFFYKNQWTTLEELAVESPKTAEIIRKICEAEKIKLPKIGIIPDDNPNAFTYGSGPWNARIIITHGIIRFLSDEERSSVVAHELGHIANRDFIIMTIASTLLQILYEIYYYTNKQKRGNSDSRSKLAIVGLIALIFYWLGSYILLYLSRVREYSADAFSAKYTDANLLADALIKIAMGILSTPGDARLIKSTRYIGVAGDAVSKQLGLVYKNCEKSGSFELLGRSLLFDLKSPWAFLAELSSTHPLSGKRIGALMKQTLAPKYDLASIEARLQIDTNRLYRGFARDLTLIIIARLAPWILGLITLIALLALHIPIEGGFLFVVTGFLVGIVVSMLIKLSMMYPANQDEPTTILEAMGDIYASPVRGRKISLEGQLVGRGIPGYIFSEDMLMQDKTGLIYVDYESRFGWIGNLFYSLKKAAENIGKDVRTSGWFFRDMSSRIVADRITGEGIDLKGGVRLWMLIGIVLMTVVSSVVGVMASGVYEESKRITVEQIYVYPVPQGGMSEEMEQTFDERSAVINKELKVFTGGEITTSCDLIEPTPAEYFTFDKETGTITVGYSNEGPKDIVIPCEIGGVIVKEIGTFAFADNKVTSVVIPDSVSNIGGMAFRNNNITTLTIGTGVTVIGDGAFAANKLTSVTIPNNVINIGDFAFSHNQLTAITIPNNVTKIGHYTFSTNKLTSVIIGNSVASIGNGAFLENQLTAIVIPDSVTSISDYAFQDNKLTSIPVPKSVE